MMRRPVGHFYNLRKQLEHMTLTDLIRINPTLADMQAVQRMMSWAVVPEEDMKTVEKLLNYCEQCCIQGPHWCPKDNLS